MSGENNHYSRIRTLLEQYHVSLPEPEVLLDWDEALQIKEHSAKEKFLRKYISPILTRIPANIRLLLTSILKNIRNPTKSFPVNMDEPTPIDVHINKQSLLRPSFCLTTDVDNKIGYDWLDKYMDIVSSAGIKLTILIVTNYDYKPDVQWLSGLDPEYFEIGLHCYDHDIGLAYRSPSVIRRKISKALESLPAGVVSFRSAALSLSECLLRIIHELGLQLDSSTSSHFRFYHSVLTTQAYRYLNPAITELPLVLQDDYFFRDAKMNDAEAIQTLRKFLTWLKISNSNCTLNLHPHNMRRHPEFLRECCSALNETYGNSSMLMKEYII